MQSDNPLFGQVNPEMATRNQSGEGGEAVSPAAVVASSASSSTAHASAAVADPPPAFVVTRAMKDEALEMAKLAAAEDGEDWKTFGKTKKLRCRNRELKVIVATAKEEAAKAREKAAKAQVADLIASGTLFFDDSSSDWSRPVFDGSLFLRKNLLMFL
jgi:hypothetical protein